MGTMPNWLRTVMIVAGLIPLGIGIVMLLYPGLALTVIVYLLAFVLIIIGLERVVSGILG